MKNRAFAKALRYKELEFLDEVEKRSSPSPVTLSSLLAIYDKLQLTEASNGVLLYATKNPRNKLVSLPSSFHTSLFHFIQDLVVPSHKAITLAFRLLVL